MLVRKGGREGGGKGCSSHAFFGAVLKGPEWSHLRLFVGLFSPCYPPPPPHNQGLVTRGTGGPT